MLKYATAPFNMILNLFAVPNKAVICPSPIMATPYCFQRYNAFYIQTDWFRIVF